jgi:hypothetical protein
MNFLKKLGMIFVGLWLTLQIIGLVAGLGFMGFIIYEIIHLSTTK